MLGEYDYCDINAIQKYIDDGGNVDKIFIDDNILFKGTLLFKNSSRGNYDVCKLLIKYGANVNKQKRSGGWTPLMVAIDNGRYHICKLLIENNADVNIDYDGETALGYAIELYLNNDEWYVLFDIIKLLIDNGAMYNKIVFCSTRSSSFHIKDHNSDMGRYIKKVDTFKLNMKQRTGNQPIKHFFDNNIMLIKLLSKSKIIYMKHWIPQSMLWKIGSYLFS
jgi:ankyrin repeat protein